MSIYTVKTKRKYSYGYFFIRLHRMILKWFVTFFVINVASCIRSIQKIPPKYNTQPTNADLVKSISDKNSFPDVVYPTSILDIANPFYYNTDNNYEVLEPFSEDVKSSYKLLSSITKIGTKNSAGNNKNKTEINKGVTPATDAVKILPVKENITEIIDTKDNFITSEVIEEVIETQNNTESILDKLGQNYDFYNVSMSDEVQNESCSKIPLLVRINIQVFKERYNESKEVIEIANNLSQDNEENYEQVKDSSNESSEKINSSSEEHNTELQDMKHSDFIETLSVLLFDLLASTDNKTDILNTTWINNESLERIVLESVENLTNSEDLDFMEPNLTDVLVNLTHSDFENLSSLTEPFRLIDQESSKGSKEDYFLDLLISLCENNKTIETVADSEYFKNPEYLLTENCTDVYE